MTEIKKGCQLFHHFGLPLSIAKPIVINIKGGGYGQGMLIAHNFSSTQKPHHNGQQETPISDSSRPLFIFHATTSPFKRGGSFPHAVPWNEIVLTPS